MKKKLLQILDVMLAVMGAFVVLGLQKAVVLSVAKVTKLCMPGIREKVLCQAYNKKNE